MPACVICCLSSVHNSQEMLLLPQFSLDFNFVWKSSGLCIEDLIRALCPQFTRNASPLSILKSSILFGLFKELVPVRETSSQISEILTIN